jgi:hypothetical protein
MEIRKYADVSTANIRQEDAKVLEQFAVECAEDSGLNTRSPAITVYDTQYGFIIPLFAEIEESTERINELSVEARNLIKVALKRKCHLLVLDCDAEKDESLPTFEW